jgi:hypothetical protein
MVDLSLVELLSQRPLPWSIKRGDFCATKQDAWRSQDVQRLCTLGLNLFYLQLGPATVQELLQTIA